MNRRHYPAFVLLLLLAGCDSMPALPSFGEPRARELSRKPANSTEYLCEGKRAFYVRAIDGGAVWLYAPDREIRLEKIADGRWGVGKVLLETSGAEATLTDPPAQFSGCKKSP
jgi:hypothetical protein